MTDIDTKYETWKNKLLDLGKRNRLLNYKDTARSTVRITEPECGVLYDMFVKHETTLVFPFEKEYDGNTEINSASNVKTDKSVNELQKTLKNLRNKSKTAIEEQGVNILYLSFGFLQWTESEDSNQTFASPLILVPVSLTVESLSSPYLLKLHEDEIVLNPTLVYKLENDFGMGLPSFDDAKNIDEFLESVKNQTALKNWSVSNDVGLSLLSFLKINMYSDLDKHKEFIVSNPLVRAISGDISAINKVPDEIADYNFDEKEKPIDVFQVVDADASQQDAILMAKKGVSFVLQGPPGTGKSQTITNIIAESLAEGKKILFVSEKMAALDVVHRRLANAGLDDFCLVLHSHKANKRSVLDQLGKVLSLGQKKASVSDEAYQKLATLQEDKEKLNNYAHQVYETVEPLGKSIYEVNGIIANLEEYGDYIFSISDIRSVSKEQYNRYIYVLSRFVSIISGMTRDYTSNPWRDSHLSSITNEFRHDIASYLNSLLPRIKEFDEAITKIFDALYLNTPHTLENIDRIVKILNVAEQAYEIPSEWILFDELQPLFDEITECINLKAKIISLMNLLKNEYAVIKASESGELLSEVDSLTCIACLLEEKNKLTRLLKEESPYCFWNENELNAISNLLGTAKEVSQVINVLKNELLQVYEPSVFDLDYKSILMRIRSKYTSFIKVFKKEYKQDKKAIQLHSKNVVKKVSDEEMVSLVDKLRRIDKMREWYADNEYLLKRYFNCSVITEESDFSAYDKQLVTFASLVKAVKIIDKIITVFNYISSKEKVLIKHYKFLYTGILSDWEEINEALKWAISFKECIAEIEVSELFIKKVCQGKEFIDICKQGKEAIENFKGDISREYNWFVSNFNEPKLFNSIELTELHNRLNTYLNSMFLLEEWIDFNTAKKDCINEGLGDFMNAIELHNIPAQNIIPVFKKRFFRLWLDAVLPEYPAVLNFRRKIQEATITEFATLDKVQFKIAKARIRSKLINGLPSLEHFTTGVDEISVLKRELNKQRRIMPIRRLFKEIPNLLLTLKPCLMMSPLSVSLFLEAETYKFDLVIFDEASQVCTENAIGAISRAQQVVIAGDSKQLPPTNFFQTAVSEGDFDTSDDDYEFDDSDAYESILDEANMLPERTLRWHYRSKHESLIAFSNTKIYKNKLITFPSNIEKADNNGVEYVYVPDGCYDRGGRKGNIAEANKVADLVFKHFKEQPNRSLGVIAFGEVQQQAIESVIRERRLQDQEYESFFTEDKEEAFFIKNLENVQGDERDTIIFSIGYAKDAAGVFRMNFGPLSKSGGERRLNVAITRAKYNVKLVGSIMPTDIDVNKINSEGPKLLRAYIDFAINGPAVLERDMTENDIVEHDSPFEEAVYNFLDRKGYKLGTQVGCSGYRIDIAVKHPTISGIYVLGIECDGAAYHSARTARERDRLRQDVLENMGWKIYRIWSTDWIKDPVMEGARLVEAIESAIADCGVTENQLVSRQAANKDAINADNFVSLEEKSVHTQHSFDRYGFEKTKVTDFSLLPRDCYGHLRLTDCIMAVVYNEFPIHYELLCQKIAPLLGNEKVTVKIKREVDAVLSILTDKAIRKGDFIFPNDNSEIIVRTPNHRKIQYISIEELSVAMYAILKTCVGTTKSALISETARVYGFNRIGQSVQTAMNNAINLLIESNKIEEVEGKLRIMNNS